MRRAMIVGGGIAGTTAALALHKAGLDAVVYEAYPRGGDDAGAFLTVGPNGMLALAQVDAAAAVAAGFPLTMLNIVDEDGTEIATAPLHRPPGDTPGHHHLRRADLYAVLHEQARRRGIAIETEDAWSTRSPAVTASGRCSPTAALPREICSSAPTACAPPCARWSIPPRRHPATTDSRCSGVMHPTRRRPRHPGCCTCCVVDGPGSGTCSPRADRRGGSPGCPAPSSAAASSHRPPRSRGGDGSSSCAADRTPAAEIVAATGKELVADNIYDVPGLRHWHRDGMIVIGDAAHAASPAAGQGASMALEDAVMLAKSLRDLPDLGLAFAAYDQLRRNRVDRVVADSAAMTGPAMPDQAQRAQENRRTRERHAHSMPEPPPWMYDYPLAWDLRVTREAAAETAAAQRGQNPQGTGAVGSTGDG